MFKKKKIKTGEVVRVVGWNGDDDKRRKTDWVSYIDSEGGKHEMEKGLNFYWDFEELESYDLYEKREHEKVVNNHFCLFAGMALKGIISAKEGQVTRESIVKEAVRYARLLSEELAHWFIEGDRVVRKEK